MAREGGSGEDWIPSTELLCAGLRPDSLISSLGRMLSYSQMGVLELHKVNLIWLSFMWMCGHSEENLSMLLMPSLLQDPRSFDLYMLLSALVLHKMCLPHISILPSEVGRQK